MKKLVLLSLAATALVPFAVQAQTTAQPPTQWEDVPDAKLKPPARPRTTAPATTTAPPPVAAPPARIQAPPPPARVQAAPAPRPAPAPAAPPRMAPPPARVQAQPPVTAPRPAPPARVQATPPVAPPAAVRRERVDVQRPAPLPRSAPPPASALARPLPPPPPAAAPLAPVAPPPALGTHHGQAMHGSGRVGERHVEVRNHRRGDHYDGMGAQDHGAWPEEGDYAEDVHAGGGMYDGMYDDGMYDEGYGEDEYAEVYDHGGGYGEHGYSTGYAQHGGYGYTGGYAQPGYGYVMASPGMVTETITTTVTEGGCGCPDDVVHVEHAMPHGELPYHAPPPPPLPGERG